jgi:surface antigen
MNPLKKSVPALLLAILFLAGCSTYDRMSRKEQTGTVVGAGGGALIGQAFGSSTGGKLLGAAIGGVAGALVGQQVGKYLDNRDQQTMQTTANRALETAPTNDRVAWNNPDTGHSGYFTPTRTYTGANGQPCRDYTQTVLIEGREEQVHGTACREPDGTWRIIGAPQP